MLQRFIRFPEFAEFAEFLIHLGKTPLFHSCETMLNLYRHKMFQEVPKITTKQKFVGHTNLEVSTWCLSYINTCTCGLSIVL